MDHQPGDADIDLSDIPEQKTWPTRWVRTHKEAGGKTWSARVLERRRGDVRAREIAKQGDFTTPGRAVAWGMRIVRERKPMRRDPGAGNV